MRKNINIPLCIEVSCIFIFLLLIFSNISIYYFSGFLDKALFTSDAFYLPTLFNDFLHGKGNINEWYLTPAPYFFPDFIIFYISQFLAPEPLDAILIFSLLQLFLMLCIISYLITFVLDNKNILVSLAVVGLLVSFCLKSSVDLDDNVFRYILCSAFHTGVFLVSLFSLVFLLKNYKGQVTIGKVVFISIISFLSTLSDNLYIVWFVVPIFFTYFTLALLNKEYRLKDNALLILSIVFSVLGSYSYNLIVQYPTRYPTSLGISDLFFRLSEVYHLVYIVVCNFPILFVIYILYFIILFFSFFNFIRKSSNNNFDLFLIFSFFLLCSTLSSLLLVKAVLVLDRYFLPVFIFPIIIVFVYLYKKYLSIFFLIIISILLNLVVINLTGYSITGNEKISIRGNYYPKDIACLDEVIKNEQVNNGAALYWDAKYYQNLTKLDLNIAQYSPSLDEFRWITSDKYFRDHYDFAIIPTGIKYKSDGEQFSENIIKENGEPKLKKLCGSRLIYVYGKNKLKSKKFNRFLNIGDMNLWKACNLFKTSLGHISDFCSVSKIDNEQSGFLTFGPYHKFPVGKYKFEISYSSSDNLKTNVGFWDVMLSSSNGDYTVRKSDLYGTDDKDSLVDGLFYINDKNAQKPLQIRTFTSSGTSLKINSIRIERVN